MKFLVPVLSCCVVSLQAQTKSVMQIAPADNAATIIRKAANVVPSPRQLRWQQLELTAFLHFGINTFTNKEWGDGKEDISQSIRHN